MRSLIIAFRPSSEAPDSYLAGPQRSGAAGEPWSRFCRRWSRLQIGRLVDEFVSAYLSVRDRVLDAAERIDPVWLEYVGADSRGTEAAAVTPCVARLVTSELHPPRDGTPVGRFSNRVVPPLGRFLPDLGEQEPAVRQLVMLAAAYGYFAMIDAEAADAIETAPVEPNVVDRTAEQIWPYWVTNMSAGKLLSRAVDKKYINRVTTVCGDDFYHGLLELGLVGWRRRKVPSMGHFYAEAGMLLRALQSDTFVPGAWSELRAAASTDRWPFDEIPEK